MKLQQSKRNQFYLTLPLRIVEAKGWKKGTEFKIKFNEKGNLEIEEVKE